MRPKYSRLHYTNILIYYKLGKSQLKCGLHTNQAPIDINLMKNACRMYENSYASHMNFGITSYPTWLKFHTYLTCSGTLIMMMMYGASIHDEDEDDNNNAMRHITYK